jgi:GNAT superfamily N-acetyltransferase
MSAVRVRPAQPADAAMLADMANDLNAHVGIHNRPFTPDKIRTDAFGLEPAFTALVAELDDAVVGYAFFVLGYNTDVAARSMWLHDIFVMPVARRRGVGNALMSAVAAEAVRAGAMSLEWGVHAANTGAIEFYRRLGAGGTEVRIMGLDGERLRALAGGRGGSV